MDPGTESPLTELESEGSAEPPPKKKRGRRVKVTEPVVYHIPPVETKTTTFKGTSDSKLVYGLNFTITVVQVAWDTYVPHVLVHFRSH